jgi:hypothetical protein
MGRDVIAITSVGDEYRMVGRHARLDAYSDVNGGHSNGRPTLRQAASTHRPPPSTLAS